MTATVTVPTEGDCDYILVSNADPDLAVAYQENGDAMPNSFSRANSGKVVTQLIEGRPKPLGFRPLIEGKADVFERTFIVAIDTAGAPAVPGRLNFQPLLTLVEAQLPSVVVCDGYGMRWFTLADWVEGTRTYLLHEHLATVRFAEVAGPTPVITDDPWT